MSTHETDLVETGWVSLTAYLTPDGGLSHLELITGDVYGELLSAEARASTGITPTDPVVVDAIARFCRRLLEAWEVGRRASRRGEDS